MLSIERGFVFIHVPKTGGNSFQILLEPYSDDRRQSKLGQDLRGRFSVRGPITSSKHQAAATYVERLGLQHFLSLKKVTFVRDPFDRAMSYYFSPHRWLEVRAGELIWKMPLFDRDAFIRSASRLRPMVEYFRFDDQFIIMDFVGRFERYEADVARAMNFLNINIPHDGLPHVNRGMVEDRLSFYDPVSVEFVRRRFAVDFETFGYSRAGPL